MTVEIKTTMYEFAHGKQPRGSGSWMFKIGAEEKHFRGTYGQAAKAAKAEAKAKGIRQIEVMS